MPVSFLQFELKISEVLLDKSCKFLPFCFKYICFLSIVAEVNDGVTTLLQGVMMYFFYSKLMALKKIKHNTQHLIHTLNAMHASSQ